MDRRRRLPSPRRLRLLGDARRVSLPLRLVLLFAWLLVLCYPNPLVLGASISHLQHPTEDARAVAALAARLPNDPRQIEQIVLTRLVPYGYDWQVNGVPWYFPSTTDVLAARRGDCESRAILLASILKAKGIPHHLEMSFDHIWVSYPGKVPNALENAAVAIGGQGKGGGFSLHWPKYFDLLNEANAQLANYWTPMPLVLRIMLFVGGMLILGCNGLRTLLAARGRVEAPLHGVRRRRLDASSAV